MCYGGFMMHSKSDIDPNKPIYPIGVVAEIIGVHPRTIRVYEQEGLIKPPRRGGKRFFSNADLQWLRCLRKLISEDGLNIAGIKKLLSMVPCWQIRNCDEETRKKCPAMLNFSTPCWEIKPQVCRQKGLDCADCEVYKSKIHHVLRAKCNE
jgi:hypothetical protein